MTNFCQNCGGAISLHFSTLPGCRCVNHPPINYVIKQIKRKWVGLTDEERDSIKHNYHNMTWTLEMFARAIEQALKEKNHG
jgi:hypothetical protein